MTKVRALVALSAYGYVKSAGEEFEIPDKGQRLDLEKLGWIEPLEQKVSAETKKAAKRAKE
jgi:hypothetical protein